MGLETGTYISDLVTTNPTSSDPKAQGDDHIRLLKSTIKTTFPNITGAVTPTHTELNLIDGLTANAAELNILDGATLTTAELNYVDGVTSAIQTQIDGKQAADADLTALAGVSATGFLTRTGAGTAEARTLTAGLGCTITNGDGVSGNPTIALQPTIGTGDVNGPSSATDNQVALYDGTTGKLIKASDIKTVNSTSLLGSGDVAIVTSNINEYTSSGTWNKPSGINFVMVECWGAGGGGGSGRRGAASSARTGGRGGGGGAYTYRLFKASELAASVAVTVGLGGTGGPSISANDTSGTSGTDGGSSSFGSHLVAYGGQKGGAGTASNGNGGNGGGVLAISQPYSTAATLHGDFGSGYIAAGTAAGQPSGFGGGMGGGSIDTEGYSGGCSYQGGAGGGAGGSISSANAQYRTGYGGSNLGTDGGGGSSGALNPTNSTTTFRYGGGGGAPSDITGSIYGGAAYGNGVFVVLTYGGGIYSSSISGTWTPFRMPETMGDPNPIIWDGSKWVTHSSPYLFSSSDLATWTKYTTGISGITGIAYGAGVYVLVTSAGYIYSSPDLVTWTARVSADTYGYTAVKWSGSYFIAVGGSGQTRTSTNGTTWNAVVTAVSTSHSLQDVEVSGTDIVATSTLTPYAVYSTNSGASWSVVATTLTAGGGRITKGSSYWLYSQSSTVYYGTSPNASWTAATDGQTDTYIDCIADPATDNYLVISQAVAGRVGISATSPGSTWTARTYTATIGAAQSGGSGGIAGGGGGGGASLNGYASGAGGNGGDGLVRVYAW